MKNRMLILLSVASMFALTSVAISDYHPPKKEVKTDLVSKTECEFTVDTYVYAVCEQTNLTGSVSEALPISAYVYPTVTYVLAGMVLHDFGNCTNKEDSASLNKRKPLLTFNRIYLSNCSIRKC